MATDTKLLTFQQVQALLGGRSRTSIYRDVDKGRLPQPRKFGGRLFWAEGELTKMIEGLPNAILSVGH